MNQVIKDIIERKCNNEDKNKALDLLLDDIRIARGIISGEFRYCSECDDYYLSNSFVENVESKPGRICIWEDPINSGGNEYEDGFIETRYSICPKGHKHVINQRELPISRN